MLGPKAKGLIASIRAGRAGDVHQLASRAGRLMAPQAEAGGAEVVKGRRLTAVQATPEDTSSSKAGVCKQVQAGAGEATEWHWICRHRGGATHQAQMQAGEAAKRLRMEASRAVLVSRACSRCEVARGS